MMATEGDVPGKRSKSKEDSGDLIDFPCYVCNEKGIRKEAVKYCIMCENYCCDECVKLHDIIPTLAHHVLVDSIDDAGDVGDSKELPSVPTERCAHHPLKIVDMFCQTHDKVGCATCISTKHDKSCKILYIPESIDVLFDFEKIKEKEQQLKLQMEKALQFKEDCLTKILKIVEAAKIKLEKYAEQLTSIITDLKQKTETKLESLRLQLEKSLAKQMLLLDEEYNIAEKVHKKLKHVVSESKHRSQQIVCSGRASEIAKTLQDSVKNLKMPDVSELFFEPHASVKELVRNLSDFSSLGSFPQKPLRRIHSKVRADITLLDDNFTSWISSLCVASNGNVLLVDRNNSLKRFSPQENRVSRYLRFTGKPYSVCVINDMEAAVTMTGQSKVYFVFIKKKMHVTSTLDLTFECRGIAFHNENLFVSDKTTVYILTRRGEELRRITSDMSENFFSHINNMTVGLSGQTLFVADDNNGLVAVDIQSGNKLWHYTDDDLKRATGVCHDGNGSIFVCGWDSHNVLQITEKGEKVGEIIGKADGLTLPWALCFAPSSSTLFVSQDGEASDELVIFKLTTK